MSVSLSSKPGSDLIDLKWNPAVSNMFAASLSDGSVTVYEIGEASLKIYGTLPSTTGATAICWSPKGKQLAVGKSDGSITQYLPTLQEAKSVPSPNVFENGTSPLPVVSLEWLSSFQFAVTYRVDNLPNLVLVTTAKAKPPSYINFDDVCYGSSDLHTLRYFMFHLSEWGIVLCSSSNAIEVGVLASQQNNPQSWEQWIVEDSGRAELPLVSKEETFPIGMALDLTSQKRIPINETDFIEPKPILHLLSTGGVLCSFYVVNERIGTQNLNKVPERLNFEGARRSVRTSIKQIEPERKVETKTEKIKPVWNSSAKPFETIQNSASSPSQGIFGRIATGKAGNISSGSGTSGFSGSITSGTPVVVTGLSNNVSLAPSATMAPQLKPIDSAATIQSRTTIIETDTTSRPKLQKSPRKNAAQNSLIAALNDEMVRFDAEIVSKRSASIEFKLGDDRELRTMAASVAEMFEFAEEAKKATRSLNLDVHALRGRALETIGAVEEARSLEQRTKEKKFVKLLRTRGLDPLSVKKIQEIRTLYFYLETQLRDANTALDKEWEDYEATEKIGNKSRKQLRSDRLPSYEMINRTVTANRNAMFNLEQQVDDLSNRIAQMKGFRSNETSEVSETIWSVGRTPKAYLKTPLTPTSYPKSNGSSGKSLTPKGSSRLRDLLSKRQVTRTRLPSTLETEFSRLLSPGTFSKDEDDHFAEGTARTDSKNGTDSISSEVYVGMTGSPNVSIHKIVEKPAAPIAVITTVSPSFTATPSLPPPNIFSIAAASSSKPFAELNFGSFKLSTKAASPKDEPSSTAVATVTSVSPPFLAKKTSTSAVAPTPSFSFPMSTQGFNFGQSTTTSSPFKFNSTLFMIPKPVSSSVFGSSSSSTSVPFSFTTITTKPNESEEGIVTFPKEDEDEIVEEGEEEEEVAEEEDDEEEDVEGEEEEEEEEVEEDEEEVETEAENEEAEDEQATAEDNEEGDDEAELLEEPNSSHGGAVTSSVPAVPQMVSQLTSAMTQSDVAKPAPVLASLLVLSKTTTSTVSAPTVFGSIATVAPTATGSLGLSLSNQTSTSAFAQSASSGFTALFGSSTAEVTTAATTAAVSPVSFRFASSETPVATSTTGPSSKVQAFSFSLPSTTTTTSVTSPATTGLTSNSLFGQPSVAPTSFAGASPVAFGTTPTETSIFGKPVETTTNTNSVFGSRFSFTQTPTTTSDASRGTLSIFGTQPSVGSTAPPPFSFGQSGSSAFSPNQGSTFGGQQTKVGFGQQPTSPSFGQPQAIPAQGSQGFGVSNNAATGSIFGQTGSGGGFFSGLGGKPDPENANKNIFGGSAAFGTTNQATSLFGSPSAASTAGSGSLWSKPINSFTTGSTTSGVGQTGFGGFQQSPVKPGGFGSTPAFGSSPTFGGVPGFGGGGAGGASSGWVFGSQSPATQTSAGFGSFAAVSDTVSFGALATQASPTTFGSMPVQNVPVTPAFGSPDPNSSFGGGGGGGSPPVFGANTGSNQNFGSSGSSQSFSQWRS